MKHLLALVIAIILCSQVSAQEKDTLIYAQGSITSAATKAPVVATINYSSLPYGSKTGFVKASSFNFPLFDNEKYAITVDAPGYASVKYVLDPAEANADRKVIKNIELGLPSAATNVVQQPPAIKKVVRLHSLIFAASTSRIQPSSFAELDSVSKMLKNNPRMVIQLEGHTDIIGVPAANLKLSQERVDAVKDYLVRKGCNKNNIKTKAFGGTQPITTENTEEAHKLNRRVELRVLEN